MKGTDWNGPEGTTIVLNIPAPNKLGGNKKPTKFDTHADNEKFSRKTAWKSAWSGGHSSS